MTLIPTTSEIHLNLLVAGETAWTVPSTFRYEPSDPFAVHIAMSAGGYVVEWIFSRELISEGLTRPAGTGDVHVYPGTNEDGDAIVHLELSSPEGEAVLTVPADELQTFLDATYASVAAGAETGHLDIDAALAELLAGC
jgi:hypothetical protein